MQTFTLQREAETARSTKGALSAGCDILEGGADQASAPHWRIPAGTYQLGFHGPSRFDVTPHSYPARFAGIGLTAGHMIEVCGVPGRVAILIHPGSTFDDTDGCLLTGQAVVAGPDGDFIVPGGESGLAFEKIWPIIAAAIRNGGAEVVVRDILASASLA